MPHLGSRFCRWLFLRKKHENSPNSHKKIKNPWFLRQYYSDCFLFRKVCHINLKGKLHYETDYIMKFQGFQTIGCEFEKWFIFHSQKKSPVILAYLISHCCKFRSNYQIFWKFSIWFLDSYLNLLESGKHITIDT